MRTNLTEYRRLEKEILAGTALEQHKRQRAYKVNLYTTEALSIGVASSDYPGFDIVLTDLDRGNVYIMETKSIGVASSDYPGFDIVLEGMVDGYIQSIAHKPDIRQLIPETEMPTENILYERLKSYFENLDIEAKISKTKEVLGHFEKYPPSHNKNLVLGALEYIVVALRKIIDVKLPKQVEVYDYISDYLNTISSIVSLSPEEFMNKNIFDLESLFRKIELFCFENKLLPKIDENNINLENFLYD